MRTREKLGMLIWPLILITAGVLFLLYNLNIITTNVWDLFLGLWPLLAVALGLNMLLVGGTVILPLLILVYAAAFLLANYGFVAWDMWSILAKTWPLFLVAFGLDVLIGASRGWGNTLVETYEQPREGYERAEIKVDGGIGHIIVTGEAPSDLLLQIEAQVSSGESFRPRVRQRDGEANVRIKHSSQWMVPFTGAWLGRREQRIHLNREIPARLIISGGLGPRTLEMEELHLIYLRVDGGIGARRIMLPGQGEYKARIDGGIGDTNIIIPAGLAARVQVSGGLGSRRIEGGLTQIGNDLYATSNYDASDHHVELQVDHGIGSLTIAQR